MRLRPLIMMSAGLCGLAAFAAESEQAPDAGKVPELRMPFAPRPNQGAKPRSPLLLRGPRQSITVRPGETSAVLLEPGAKVCAVPLLDALRGAPPVASRMPSLKPAPNRFATREAVLPAPPCPAGP